MQRKISLLPHNDKTCGWIRVLPPRKGFPVLAGKKTADWVVIGGGYTGLAFARRMAEARPEDHIILVEAQLIGEGASARNSGFSVSTSCFGTPYKERQLEAFLRVNRLNRAGIDCLREIVTREHIDCQWRETGKVHVGVETCTQRAGDDYVDWLQAAGVAYEDLSETGLSEHLGTPYYKRGIWTKDDVMLQPAALARGLSETLPVNVTLYEGSPVHRISRDSRGFHLHCPGGEISAPKLILASNGFLHTMTPRNSHTVPLVLTASLTRPLNKAERLTLGNPDDWGALSLNATGATVRYTSDHRIMVRNTVAYKASARLNNQEMKAACQKHRICLDQRFPMLQGLTIEHSWAGVTCMSRNGSILFGELDDGIFAAGCYSGSGVSKGCTLGYALADHALGESTPLLTDVLHYAAPNWIPPRPILDVAMAVELGRRKLGTGADA